MKMKTIRKWSRILHRDIGYFFIFTSLIYGISGIALNHLSDWNPNYSVTLKPFKTSINLQNKEGVKDNVLLLLDKIDNRNNYKKHYYKNDNHLKIFLKGGSSVDVNVRQGVGEVEYLKRRPIFYESNFLHYNPNRIWTWFSDAFAAALILFAITSLFMVKGKKGIKGRGGIYLALGILIPIVFLLFYL
jgi:hypothetical protein